MNYNPQEPIAVFLGPSLEKSHACQLLTANYYPPARMGDIYQLLGSGVRIIVLIDGIFHNAASVWQRELLEALDNNITVMGASSMGALRAAELHYYGMIGYGTIFEWYRDRVIEGDDEVALTHADESLGFRPFSEPLVNIRYNLWCAVRQNYICSEQGAELIEYAKKTYYADRSYDSLLNSSIVKKWPQSVQEQLTQFIRQQAVNLKKEDAMGALNYGAMLVKQSPQQTRSSMSSRQRGRYYRSVRYGQRGFLHADGYLVSGETLLTVALQDIELIRTLRPVLIKNHFLRLWAKQRQLKCPPDYLATYRRLWEAGLNNAPEDQWLRVNGLTGQEFQTEFEQRALLAWLVGRGPTAFGLDFEPYVQFLEALLKNENSWELRGTRENPNLGQAGCSETFQVPMSSDEGLFTKQENKKANQRLVCLRQASEICCLATWARENGLVCPPAHVEKFIKKWEETHQVSKRAVWLKAVNLSETVYLTVLGEWAGYDWLIEKGPPYFGYTSWSFQVALLKELQMTGQAARMVEKL